MVEDEECNIRKAHQAGKIHRQKGMAMSTDLTGRSLARDTRGLMPALPS
jgi:hypothetical protein